MVSLELRRISKSFGSTPVLQDVDLALAQGDICVIVGPSGCGKTTMLRIVAGLERAFDGEIILDGQVANKSWPSQRDLSMVFQGDSLFSHLTGFQNMAYPLRGCGIKREEIRRRIEKIAALLNVTNILQRRPQEMSGGERQRIAIGRSLARGPGCLLLDEPMASLDPHLRGQLRDLLRKIHETNGGSMLLASHDQADAMQLGHKVAVMNKGRIEQFGTPMDIFRLPINRFVASFFGQAGMNFLGGTIKTTDRGPQLLLENNQQFAIKGEVQKEQRVELGLRPESLLPAAIAPKQWAHIQAAFESCRFNGGQLEVTLRVTESNVLRAALPISMSEYMPTMHEQVTFAFDAKQALIFSDNEIGARLDIGIGEGA